MIKVNSAEIELTENIVRDLMRAIEEEKAKMPTFYSGEVPVMSVDLDERQRRRLLREKGIITVGSIWSKHTFLIKLELEPNTQEPSSFMIID